MRNSVLDEIGDKLDMLFAVAMAAVVGIGATNLAIHLNMERTTFDAAAVSQKLSQSVQPPMSAGAGLQNP